MTSQNKLLLFTVIFLVLSFLITILLFLWGILSKDSLKSILLAEAITTFNALFGLIYFKSGLNKSVQVFFRRVFGGIVVRLVSTLVFVVFALYFLELNRISFIFSILFFYVFFLVIEIIYLNFHQN